MRPAAVPGVVGLLLGRRGQKRAPWSGGSGAGAGECGLRLIARLLPTMGRVVAAGVHAWALQLGYTAFMLAAQNGHLESMQVLLDRGADPEIRDNVSHSPLGLGLAVRGP